MLVAVGVGAAFANLKTCYRYIIDRHRGDLVAKNGRKHHIRAGAVVIHRGLVTIGHRTMPDDRAGHAVGAQLPLGHQFDVFIKNRKRRIGGHDTIIAHPAGEVVVVLGRHVAGHGNGCTRGIVERREIALRLASSKIINDRVACNRPARRGSDHGLIQHHLCRMHVPVRVGRNLGTRTANSAGHNGDLDDQLLALCTVYIVCRVIVAGHANGFAFNSDIYARSRSGILPAVPVPICGIDLNVTARGVSEGEIIGKRIDHRGRCVQLRIRRRGNVLTDRRKDVVQISGIGSGLVIPLVASFSKIHFEFSLCSSLRIVGRGRVHIFYDVITWICKHADRVDRSAAILHAFRRVDDVCCHVLVEAILVVWLAVGKHDNDLGVLQRWRCQFSSCQFHAVVGRRCAACPQAVNGSFKRFRLSHRCQSHNDLGIIILIVIVEIIADSIVFSSGKLHNGNSAFRRVFRNAINEAVDGILERVQLALPRRLLLDVELRTVGTPGILPGRVGIAGFMPIPINAAIRPSITYAAPGYFDMVRSPIIVCVNNIIGIILVQVRRINFRIRCAILRERIRHRAGNIQHEGNVERLRFYLRGRFAGRPCFHGDGIGPISIGSGILIKLHSGVLRRQGADGQQTERHHARHQHCHQSPFHSNPLLASKFIHPAGGEAPAMR